MNPKFLELSTAACNVLHKRTGQTWGYNPTFANEYAKLIIDYCVNHIMCEAAPTNEQIVFSELAKLRIRNELGLK